MKYLNGHQYDIGNNYRSTNTIVNDPKNKFNSNPHNYGKELWNHKQNLIAESKKQFQTIKIMEKHNLLA